jgi:hypothetical protein
MDEGLHPIPPSHYAQHFPASLICQEHRAVRSLRWNSSAAPSAAGRSAEDDSGIRELFLRREVALGLRALPSPQTLHRLHEEVEEAQRILLAGEDAEERAGAARLFLTRCFSSHSDIALPVVSFAYGFQQALCLLPCNQVYHRTVPLCVLRTPLVKCSIG